MSAKPRLPQLQMGRVQLGGGGEGSGIWGLRCQRDPDLKLNLFYVHWNAICVDTGRKT